MKWCVSFPDEEMLIVRPCLVAICMGNRPAAKLLSVLLYRYSIRKEHKEDAENINDLKASRGEKPNQDTTFRIYRKQAQLVNDMCGEIVEKTLHDVAVPTLQLLGYLDVDESPSVHCYDVHLDLVIEALETYKQGAKQLEAFLINHLQLEKFLITTKLEKLPINKKHFQLALEKVLIANRNVSNNKRGRKPSPDAARRGKKSNTQITREILEDSNRDKSDDVASANHHDTPSSFSSESSLPSHEDSAASGGTPTQPANTMTVPLSTMSQSNDAQAPTPSVASQTNNDRGENVAPSESPLTASTGDTPSQESRIANATPTTDDNQTTPSRSGENATVDGGVPAEQSTPPESGATQQPRRRSRSKSNKQAVDLDHVEVLPPPAKPDESMPWTARKVLAWGDFFRGYVLPESENGNSHYMQNEKAAVSIIQRGITEKNFVSVFRFMHGKKITTDGTLADDPTFRDEWWPENMSADVRHVDKHYTDIGAKIKGRGKNGAMKGVSIQQQLQDAIPDFPMKTQAELADMQLDQRRAYSRELTAYLKTKREQEERAQSEQCIPQQASA